jgi:hypothetical protein
VAPALRARAWLLSSLYNQRADAQHAWTTPAAAALVRGQAGATAT